MRAARISTYGKVVLCEFHPKAAVSSEAGVSGGAGWGGVGWGRIPLHPGNICLVNPGHIMMLPFNEGPEIAPFNPR